MREEVFTFKELKALNTFKVVRHFKGKYAKEDIEEFKKFAIENGFTREDETTFRQENGGGFIFKPKMERSLSGSVLFRTKDYIFITQDKKTGKIIKSYGDLKALTPTVYGFYLKMFNGEVLEYHLV